MLSSTAPQLIGIAVLVLLRPLFYTFVSDFVAKIFGCVRRAENPSCSFVEGNFV
jgi:hypothetical protein